MTRVIDAETNELVAEVILNATLKGASENYAADAAALGKDLTA